MSRDALKERIDKYVAKIPDELPEDPFTDGEEGEEPDLEYKVESFDSQLDKSEAEEIRMEALLNDGWEIEHAFVRGPRLTLVLYREKED